MPQSVQLTSNAGVGNGGITVRPRDGSDGRAELPGNRLRLLVGTVGDPDLPRTILQQRHDHSPCGASGAKQKDWPLVRTPVRFDVAQTLDKSVAVIVEAAQRAVRFDDDGIDGTNAARSFVDTVEQRSRRLLVRHGHVTAAKAERDQSWQRVL